MEAEVPVAALPHQSTTHKFKAAVCPECHVSRYVIPTSPFWTSWHGQQQLVCDATIRMTGRKLSLFLFLTLASSISSIGNVWEVLFSNPWTVMQPDLCLRFISLQHSRLTDFEFAMDCLQMNGSYLWWEAGVKRWSQYARIKRPSCLLCVRSEQMKSREAGVVYPINTTVALRATAAPGSRFRIRCRIRLRFFTWAAWYQRIAATTPATVHWLKEHTLCIWTSLSRVNQCSYFYFLLKCTYFPHILHKDGCFRWIIRILEEIQTTFFYMILKWN